MSISSTIHVTHVEALGPFLKICGQTSRNSMDEIENTLRTMHLQLMTHRLEPNLNDINSEDIYLVQANAEALFRRCNALDVKLNGMVKVFLIDYGQELEIHVSMVRFLMFERIRIQLLTMTMLLRTVDATCDGLTRRQHSAYVSAPSAVRLARWRPY